MAVINGRSPEDLRHYQALVDQHGVDVVHHALRIHPESNTTVAGLTFTSTVPGADADTKYRAITHLDVARNLLINHGIMRGATKTGEGTKTLARQVIAARKMGVSKILIPQAAGDSESTLKGYYIWPRLGFNGPHNHPDFWKHKDMHSIMANPRLAELWKRVGQDLHNLEFDVSPDSEHSKRLVEYMKSRKLEI